MSVVIDHFARVDIGRGLDQAPFRLLLDLIGEGNVWVKISGADRFVAKGCGYGDVVPFAHALIENAPDRVVWGTDWPHSNIFVPGITPNDGDLLDLLTEFAPEEAVRRKILAKNPAALFGFEPV